MLQVNSILLLQKREQEQHISVVVEAVSHLQLAVPNALFAVNHSAAGVVNQVDAAEVLS